MWPPNLSPMATTETVFIVESDHSVRVGLTRLLGAAGYSIRGYATAEEFVAALGPDTSGCLVLDTSVENLSTEIGTLENRLAIIVITAQDDEESRRTAKQLNAAAYFRKPVDGTALLDAIRFAQQ